MPPQDCSKSSLHFVVVCAGGDAADLQGLLHSLAAQETELGVGWEYHISVVENSGDASDPDILRLCNQSRYTTLLHPPRNLGYGTGINFGANQNPSESTKSWIIICNADLVFPPGSLQILAQSLASIGHERNGLLAPKLLDPPNPDLPNQSTTQPSVGTFPSLLKIIAGKLRPQRTRKYIRTPDQVTNIDWATGACLAVRADAFVEIAGFDESFFLDYEDVDLCRRLADAQWQRLIDPRWQVIHTHPLAQRSIPNLDRLTHTRASLIRYTFQHRPRWEFHTLGILLKFAIRLRSSQHPLQAAWQAGHDAYGRLAAASKGSKATVKSR